MAKQSNATVVKNRKAYHDYTILEVWEAGIVLQGTEVKSLREHKVQMQDSYVQVKGTELFLIGLWIAPYSHGNLHNHLQTRPRKLLLHKKQILKIRQKSQEKHLTIIPLNIHLTQSKLFKVDIALGKGKKQHDKREKIKEQEDKRSMERAMKPR